MAGRKSERPATVPQKTQPKKGFTLRPLLNWAVGALNTLWVLAKGKSGKALSLAIVIISVAVGVLFARAINLGFQVSKKSRLSCNDGLGLVQNDFSYLEIDVKDQMPTEPFFDGTLFVNLGNKDKGPLLLNAVKSGNSGYLSRTINLNIAYDSLAKQYWSQKRVDMGLERVSGSHRDFPFDSAKFDFTISFTPVVQINNVIIRNRNQDFYPDCDSLKVDQEKPGVFHIKFDVRRNPLVQLTATVLVLSVFFF